MFKTLDKQRIMEWFEMRVDGYTYAQIATKYGVSKQCVWDALKRKIELKSEKTIYDKVVYPEIRKFMESNEMFISDLAAISKFSTTSVSKWVQGKLNPPMAFVDFMIQQTGIPYEKLFCKEEQI